MFAVYFLLLVLPLVSAQVNWNGHCPIPNVQPNFNLYAYAGVWYELASFPNPFSQGTCGTVLYEIPRGNSYLEGKHCQVKNGEYSCSASILRIADRYIPGRLEIQFQKSQPFSPYWVLYTDYERYAVLYSCEDHGDTHSQYVWVIGREPYLDPKALLYIMHQLLYQRIQGHKLKVRDQSCYTKTPFKTDFEAVFAGRDPLLCYASPAITF